MNFTPEEIAAMAEEVGFIPRAVFNHEEALSRFATLVADKAAARATEVAAQVAADTYFGNAGEVNHEIAAAIRARGQKGGV
jgi:hypothetical protein